MLTLAEAQARLLALAEPLPVERVPVDDALGRYLAEPVVARRTQPPADLSAMDGYAVRDDDLAGPWTVVGESSCGHSYEADTLAFGNGMAIRIATGALLPTGAGAIIVQEDCQLHKDMVRLIGSGPVPHDKHIRRKGHDFVDGQQLLGAGTKFGPAQLALALSGGHSHVAVRRLPRIALIDSGDELSVDPTTCAVHQIPASNAATIEALIRSALPCTATRIGPVADRLESLVEALNTAADADVIVTSGGASVGDHDLVRPALEAWGAELDFWKVAVKPGKPIMVARRGAQLVVGLPGNPVSSHVTAYLFVLPLLRALLGAGAPLPRAVSAISAEDFAPGDSRQEFLRGFWDGRSVTRQLNQDSGALGALAASNALIERPIGAPAVRAGEPVSIYLLQNGGIA